MLTISAEFTTGAGGGTGGSFDALAGGAAVLVFTLLPPTRPSRESVELWPLDAPRLEALPVRHCVVDTCLAGSGETAGVRCNSSLFFRLRNVVISRCVTHAWLQSAQMSSSRRDSASSAARQASFPMVFCDAGRWVLPRGDRSVYSPSSSSPSESASLRRLLDRAEEERARDWRRDPALEAWQRRALRPLRYSASSPPELLSSSLQP